MPKNLKILIFASLAITSITLLLIISKFLDNDLQLKAKIKLPIYGEVSDFRLTTQFNSKLSLEDLSGTVWIADFIFTRCGGPCPIMSSEMFKLQKTLPKTIKLVSFSIDPEYDSPEVLKEYSEKYRADPSRWIFLTGDKNRIHKIAKDVFKLSVFESQDQPPSSSFIHSTHLVLVDSNRKIRGYYSGTNHEDVSQLIDDAKSLSASGRLME